MLNNEVKEIWNTNAEFWDSRMGEGNEFHKTLLEPIQLDFLNIKPGDKILDIACGNGQFSRKMAELGAKVTAIDFSEKFIQLAKQKSNKNINYKVVDVTKDNELDTLKDTIYDSIVCTMAIMDIENIEPMINKLPELLKSNGIFVFSILHPCFNSGENSLCHERDDFSGRITDRYSVKISNYLIEKNYLGIGMNGQPKSQYYFHRPISSILKLFFKIGFVLDGFEEPSFKNITNGENTWHNVFSNIPPALICRILHYDKKD